MRETDILARYKAYLLIVPIFVLFTCTKLTEFDNQQIRQALADSLLTTTESWNVDMNLVENGKLVLNLRGDHALTIRNTDLHETRISGPVFIDIYEDNGNIKSTVTCDSAIYKPDETIFEMFGTVNVLTENGRNLRSEFLKWNRKEDQVSTPKFVIFISPPDSISANGFIGNTDLTNYTLNEASGEVVID